MDLSGEAVGEIMKNALSFKRREIQSSLKG